MRLFITIAGVLMVALALSGVTAAAGPGETGNGTIPPGFTKVTFIHTADGPPDVAVEHGGEAGAPPFASGTASACTNDADNGTAQCDSFLWDGQYWPGAAVTYNVNLKDSGDDGGFLAAIQASAQTWEADAASDFDFTFGGTTGRKASSLRNRMDGNNDITWDGLGRYQDPIAVTIFWYFTATGVVVEVDLINNKNFAWASDGDPNAYDVQNIETHEFGHYLVLGDLYDPSDSGLTMFGFGAPGETQKVDLGVGDRLGIAAIYPGNTPTGSIAGTVDDGTAGIGGATVSTGTGQSTTTADDGSYTLSGVPTGSSTVTASAGGYVSDSATTTVAENATSAVNFTLAPVPTGSVAGTVTDVDGGSPIGGATVSTDTGESTTTASDGSYTLTGVPAGSRTVTASAAGYADSAQAVSVTDGGSATEDFQLTAVVTGDTVSVDSFAYTGAGGRNKDKHVSVQVALVDNLGGSVGGASISVRMDSNSGASASGSGTTGDGGTITFTWSNAPGDCYTTTVTSVTADGLSFDPTGSTSVETCKVVDF